ncbi:procathepsin L-like, partial [Varanus komodoensis]|uniref:procathepsin L-like n=1 Tax=Varanus komodoensis TaxID=61221 RepID=UPI001CF77CE3
MVLPSSLVAVAWLLSQGTLSAVLVRPLEETWRAWKATHGKEYAEGEEAVRRGIWEKNLRMIERHNREAALGKHSFELGMNHFGDWTNEEFNKLNGLRPELGRRSSGQGTVFNGLPDAQVPSSVDWREEGYVTPVKNQGSCGSCWAFSAVGALEGLHYKTDGKLVGLSEQNLVDCAWTYGNKGCNGGNPTNAFAYVMNNQGIDSEKAYPYQEKDERCLFNDSTVAAACTGFLTIPEGKTEILQEAVGLLGPVSVGIDASSMEMQFYRSGIFYLQGCGESVNHAVLLVGYGSTEDDLDYWIVKN